MFPISVQAYLPTVIKVLRVDLGDHIKFDAHMTKEMYHGVLLYWHAETAGQIPKWNLI